MAKTTAKPTKKAASKTVTEAKTKTTAKAATKTTAKAATKTTAKAATKTTAKAATKTTAKAAKAVAEAPLKGSAVGDQIASMCTKCNQPEPHLIAALTGARVSKVKCSVCGSLHRYINPDTPPKTTRRRSRKPTPEEVWEKMVDLLEAKRKKVPYTFAGHFKENDLIDHNTFGIGVVTLLLPGDKIQVTFKDGEKILIARR